MEPNKFHDAFNLPLRNHFDSAPLEETKKILDTLMKRRTEAQGDKDFPKRTEISVYLPLSPLQVVLYRIAVNYFFSRAGQERLASLTIFVGGRRHLPSPYFSGRRERHPPVISFLRARGELHQPRNIFLGARVPPIPVFSFSGGAPYATFFWRRAGVPPTQPCAFLDL